MASVRGQEAGRRQRVIDVVGARVEQSTRFRASELKELQPEQDTGAELVVTTRQRVELELSCFVGPGRLPEGIEARPDRATVEAELQQRLATAESATATAIQRWATEEPGRYRRLLAGGTLFAEALGAPIGTDWACPTCAQRGRLPCTGCIGQGSQACPDCQGRCRGTCLQCRGLGRLACGTCEGRGQVPGPPGHAGAATEPLVPCSACSQGWLRCTACDGQGEQACARCGATGQIVCPDCEGTCETACPDCAATGWQHVRGRLHDHVEVEDLLEVHHPDPVIAAAVTERFHDVTTLDTPCTVEQVRYTTAPLAVQAVQRLRLPVRQARLLVAGQPMDFTALGPELDLVDLQPLGNVLLAHDLATLEKNAAGSGRHLGDALQRFLQSPLNAEIAARLPAAEIGRLFPGLVDAAYIERAVQATQRALERLWLQRAWRLWLLCLAGAGLVAALAVGLGSPVLGLWSGAALGLAAGLLGGGVADWQIRRSLAATVQVPHGDRLLRPLRRSATLRRWQGLSLAAAALVALASAASVSRLPHVRAHTAQAQARADLSRQLDDWLVREGKDHRLRRYPDAEALTQALARTPVDPRVRVVRAWQLLLGPDGVEPDPRAAERLLEGLAGDPQLGSAAVIGQARAALALRGRSVPALQAAIDALDTLPEPALPEAVYTRALLQLAPAYASRLGGPQTGLATLQQAADLGHASACFELGRRLASGHGVRRDPVAARRYLGYADAKGVPGAAQALAALR